MTFSEKYMKRTGGVNCNSTKEGNTMKTLTFLTLGAGNIRCTCFSILQGLWGTAATFGGLSDADG